MPLPFKNKMKWRDEHSENPLKKNPELFHASLDEFAAKSFHEASLNDILKAVKMNKGSFYYRFYDKMDLYLSLFHKIGMDKLEYFKRYSAADPFPEDFFERIKKIARLGLSYAKTENRYFGFWRKYLSEAPAIHYTVKDNFKELSSDIFSGMVAAARDQGQFSPAYSDGFIGSITELLLNHMDSLIPPDICDEHILSITDQLADFMKKGLGP